MIAAAGIMFLANGREVLFVRRGADGDHPGFWAFPGGKIEAGETAEEAAAREAVEEIGEAPGGQRVLWARDMDGMSLTGEQVDFTTFLQRVPSTFDPALNDEHTAFVWARPDDPPEPLHPGCVIALAKLSMNELDIARSIAAGELPSPTLFYGSHYFALRFSGTGVAYRPSADEFAFRDQKIWLTDAMARRIAGVPVIAEHAETRVMTGDELSSRIVGIVVLGFLKGSEIWCVARIVDQDAAAGMNAGEFDTSPAVLFAPLADNAIVTSPKGEKILVEGEPSFIDHLALVWTGEGNAGVWSKGGTAEPAVEIAPTETEDQAA